MAELQNLKNKVKNTRGQYTRLMKAGDRMSDFAVDNATSATVSQMENMVVELQDRKRVCVDGYIQLQEVDEAVGREAIYAARLDSLEDEHAAIIEKMLHAIKEAKRPPAVAVAAAPVGAAANVQLRVQTALKPSKLSYDATPSELTSWARQFRAFHSASKLGTAAVTEQQAFFFSCLDLELETAVRQRIDDATVIFDLNNGDRSCMEELQSRFQITYPLFTRRLDYFRYIQSKGQTFSDFYAHLRQKGDEAELAQLTVDECYVFRVICGCSDSKLKEKFLKLENPTLEDLLKESTLYEMAKRSLSAFNRDDSRTATTRAARQQQSKGGKEKEKGKDKAKDKPKCRTCGGGSHAEGVSCFALKLECHECHQTGHIAKTKGGVPVCNKLKNKGKSRASSPSNAEAKTVSCRVVSSPNRPTPKLSVRFAARGGKEFDYDVVPDTGATRSIVALDVIERHGIEVDTSQKIRLTTANKQLMACSGTVQLVVKDRDVHDIIIDAIVSQELSEEFLMSWHDLVAMGVIPDGFPCRQAQVRRVETVDQKQLDQMMNGFKEEYKDVLGDTLDEASGAMKGRPMKIVLKDEEQVKPLKILTSRQVPVHMAEMADKLVEELVRTKVLVFEKEPTDWISPAHFVPKPCGKKVRLVTDYRRLNQVVDRPVHPFPSANDLIRKIHPDSKIFCKLDAIHGYFQIPLDEESSKLTTFLLPSGRYRYTRAPMGLKSSSDEFCQRTDEAFIGLTWHEWFMKIVDDMLIQATDIAMLKKRLTEVFDRCRKAGIKLSLSKMQCGESVKFAGFIVGCDGVKPDPDKTRSISEFPVPESVPELRSFLGLVNQLGFFVPDLAQMTSLMRGLLKKNVAYVWLQEHQDEFEKVKEMLCSDMLVKPFDMSLDTELYTDASRLYGIGYALIQRDAHGKIRLIQCGSQSLSSAQRNYATIELECLAIKWAIEKCRYYLRGSPQFRVVTDHKPLLGIFAKPLSELENVRLSRFREKLVDYDFVLTWTAGKDHCVADALSRAPVFICDEDDEPENSTLCYAVAEDPALQELVDLAARDGQYKKLIKGLRDDADPKHAAALKPYANIWPHLSLFDDQEETLVVYNDTRIVVPEMARRELLLKLHLPHSGMTKTFANARQLYFWPGMKNSIKQITENCEACQALLPSLPKETLRMTVAAAPMEQVAVDLFDHKGQDWLVMVDRYSGFPFTKRLRSTTSEAVTSALTAWFVDWGYPEKIRSDGGPQFRAKFVEYCERKNIVHELSSPYNSQSNGLAEAAVKNVKYLLAKCAEGKEDFAVALLEWRNVPRANGVSPAQAFLGRRQRGNLPQINKNSLFDTRRFDQEREEKLTKQSDKSDLELLSIDQQVLIQDPVSKRWNRTGYVSAMHGNGRSYQVEIDGKSYRRNRRFLRLCGKQRLEEKQIGDDADQAKPALRRSVRFAEKKSVTFAGMQK